MGEIRGVGECSYVTPKGQTEMINLVSQTESFL